MNNDLYTQQRFLLMTLDPVHIGTGGYRLGRVDLSIVREPGTNLPKIPGTSLSGAARSYAAMRYGKPQCAGQGGSSQPHCGQPTCPICYTFGTVRGTAGGSAGTVSLSDARLLLFPVHSMAGPVWVTSPSTLADFGIENPPQVSANKAKWSGITEQTRLNLGWLMLEKEEGDWPVLADLRVPPEVKNRIVLVSDKLFSHIVNSNLEVRTSVSIDPRTGAAAEGALFTYEALPRATWLWMDVVEDDYQRDPVTRESRFPITERKCKAERRKRDDREEVIYIDNAGEALGETWSRPLDVVRAGLQLAEYLGIGGMGTRGFGRIKLVAD